MKQQPNIGSGTVSDGGTVEPERGPRFKPGLLAKTTFTLLLIGICPLLAFGGYMLVQQRAELSKEAARSLQANAEQISGQVEEWFDKNVRVMRVAAALPKMVSMQRGDQTPLLLAIRRAYPWIYLVHTVGLDGKNVARSDDQPLADYSDRQYLKDVRDIGKDLSWLTAIGKTSGKPALNIAVPIRADGNLVGVLVAAMAIEDTSKIVAQWRSGDTGFAFLVDEKAKVLAHPSSDFVLTQKVLASHPMVAAALADHQPHLGTFVENGKDTLAYVKGNASGWQVVVQQSKDELFAPLRSILTVVVLLLLAAIALSVVLAIVSSRTLVRPLVEMTSAADRMSLGELDTPVVWKSRDELSLLAHALERLRKSMRAAMKRIG